MYVFPESLNIINVLIFCIYVFPESLNIINVLIFCILKLFDNTSGIRLHEFLMTIYQQGDITCLEKSHVN